MGRKFRRNRSILHNGGDGGEKNCNAVNAGEESLLLTKLAPVAKKLSMRTMLAKKV